ncbi:MAG: hypothetical protein CL761_01050 [Chloroflexi bacterium]|nr:hypothetical protein [Chloroflexota bacterium]
MNISELIDYLTVAFLLIFSFMGILFSIALIVFIRNVNKIKNQFDTANEKIDSFKESITTINKSVEIFKSLFGFSSKKSNN